MKPHCRPDIIPANIVGFLAALPRTGLGKIDREKLEAINRPK
jgi:acyl-coenzyme A synthetase/AMP-(fatty) acid ligase